MNHAGTTSFEQPTVAYGTAPTRERQVRPTLTTNNSPQYTPTRPEEPGCSAPDPARRHVPSSGAQQPTRGEQNLPAPNATSRRCNFASNGFDPNGFYGEDEEDYDEEDEDRGHDSLREENRYSYNDPSQASPTGGSWDGRACSAESTAPGSFLEETPAQLAHSPDNQQQQLQGKTLTTDDLLDLFGGSSTQPEAESTSADQEGNLTTGKGKENAPPVEREGDLALPPPSDSSDDEEEA